MTNTLEAYDLWHSKREVNARVDEVWHRAVLQAINLPVEFTRTNCLEIGCGRGGFSIWLAMQPFAPQSIVAADISTAALNKARKASDQLGVNVSWIQASIMEIPFQTEHFDIVVSFETIEHVEHPLLAINELVRVLRRGGRFILTTPHYMNAFGLWRVYRRLIGRPYAEAGQPINRPMILPWYCAR